MFCSDILEMSFSKIIGNATTFRPMALRIMALCLTTLHKKHKEKCKSDMPNNTQQNVDQHISAFSTITLSTISLSRMTLSTMALSIMPNSVLTINIMTLIRIILRLSALSETKANVLL